MGASLNNLPSDLLVLIGASLDQYRDYAHLRSSSSWLRNSLPKWPSHFSYPCLMLPDDDEDDNEDEDKPLRPRGFYNLINKEVKYYELPESSRRHCVVGSSNGWLVTLEEGNILSLLNPLDQSEIPLPRFSTLPDTHIVKIVLSFSSPGEFIAVAIYGAYGHLAFTKFGHHKWTHIHTPPISYFQDCVFADGKIYALNVVGDVVVSTVHNPSRILAAHVNKPIPSINLSADCIYLVKTDHGELLMLEKMTLTLDPDEGELRNFDAAAYGFKVFKMDSSNRKGWIPIDDLGDYAVFLGFNTSACISSRCLPNLKGNCIYYTDDYTQAYTVGHGFGVFNMSDGTFQTILCEELPPLRLPLWPRSIWVMLKCC